MRSFILAATLAVQGQKSVTDPIYSCPFGFDLNGKTCEKQTTAQPELVCAIGKLQGFECVLQHDKIRSCPSGTREVGKQCVAQEYIPAEPVCPIGYENNGVTCEATVPLEQIEVCERGSREGPDCVIVDSAAYIVEQRCPEGFMEAAKGGCWRSVSYDCTPAQGKAAHGLRGLIGASRPVNARLNVTEQLCERKEAAPKLSERYCPDGFQDTGNSCIKKQHFPLVKKCSNGGPLSDCNKQISAPFEYTCPSGGIMKGQQCEFTRQEAPVENCTVGMEDAYGNCVTSTPAENVCAPGLQLSGGLCIGMETAEPEVQVVVTCTGKNCYH